MSADTSKPISRVLEFVSLKGRPDIARTQINLFNGSNKSLRYKIKCDQRSNISALPAGSGCILPNGMQRCDVTWHRPKEFKSWDGVPSPKMQLETHFMPPVVGKKTVIKLIAVIINLDEKETEQKKVPISGVKFIDERKKQIYDGASSQSDVEDGD
uniref:Major sperm protein n=1 Tax=Parascaris univalens TaxID=6257 RepID=A0A915C3G3_PARUN